MKYMYISVKLAPQTTELLLRVRTTLFGDYKFIAQGTVINKAWEMLRNDVMLDDYIPPKGALFATEPKRLNLTAACNEGLNSLCASCRLTKTEAIQTILSAAIGEKRNLTAEGSDGITWKIMSLNVNDFGGYHDHLLDYKTPNGCIDWAYWANRDKNQEIEQTYTFLKQEHPDLVFLQEVEINNSQDSAAFLERLKQELNYNIYGNFGNSWKASVTVCCVRKDLPHIRIDEGQQQEDRSGRDFRIFIGNTLLMGVHVPPRYDAVYWDKLCMVAERHTNLVIVGDFNTFSDEKCRNRKRFEALLSRYHLADAWPVDSFRVPTCGNHIMDHLLVPETRRKDMVKDMKITHTLFTDHAALCSVLML